LRRKITFRLPEFERRGLASKVKQLEDPKRSAERKSRTDGGEVTR
jgi:hypothetical protein